MNWNNLSLKQKADIIKMSVQSGITDLSVIQQLYDSSQQDKQDTDLSYTAGSIVDNLHKAAIEERSLGTPSHNYDFTQSEEWANAHGYYPDSRGHRDDRVKKPSHPTHPSRGTWNSDREFQLTDLGFEDPNYTIFGMADRNQDPQAILSYKGNIVLPELTVTPKGNYYNNSYDNVQIKLSKGGLVQRKNKFEDGGTIEPVDYETPWGITTRNRYRGQYIAPTSAIYFKSKQDRDTYAAQQDIDLYGGILPELEVVAKGTPTQDILTEDLDKNERNPVNLIDPNGSIVLRGITVTPQSAALNRSRRAKGPNADFSNAQDMTWIQQLGATYLTGAPIIDIDPHTCLNTVTGFYDPENTVASNVNIATNPERYGYREIPQSEAIPGDLIILSNSNGHPNHAVMFDEVSNGYGKSNNGYPIAPGDTLVNYSNGGRSSDNYRLQEPLKRFNDRKNAGGDFLGPRIYLRYTGKREKK